MAPVGGLDGFHAKLSNEGMKGGEDAVVRTIPLRTPGGRRPATSHSPEHRPDFTYSPQDSYLSWSPMSATIGAATPDRAWPARMSERLSPAAPRPTTSHSSWSPGSTAAAGLVQRPTTSHLSTPPGGRSPTPPGQVPSPGMASTRNFGDSAGSMTSTSSNFPRTRSRRRPNDAEKNSANLALADGRRSSHAYGFRGLDGVVTNPPLVPRPASSVTISLRNPAVRVVCEPNARGNEHRVSSDAIGLHTGTLSDRGRFVRPRTSITAMARADTATSPVIWQRTTRTSDAIGTHPAPPPLDWSNPAAVQYEATYSRAFPGDRMPVANRTHASRGVDDAQRFQEEWMKRAATFDAPRMKEHASKGADTSLMADGQKVAKLDFDAVYSQAHITRDTESVLVGNGISTVDPRRNLVRPKSLGYGSSIDGQPTHRVSTSYGARRVMPSRSFMKCARPPCPRLNLHRSRARPLSPLAPPLAPLPFLLRAPSVFL